MTYRQLHEEQLRQNRPEMYRDLKRSGELQAHLDHIAQTAKDMHALVVKQLAERHPYHPVDGPPWIMLEPVRGTLPILKAGDAHLGLTFRDGVKFEEAERLAAEMRAKLRGVSYTKFIT